MEMEGQDATVGQELVGRQAREEPEPTHKKKQNRERRETRLFRPVVEMLTPVHQTLEFRKRCPWRLGQQIWVYLPG